MTSATVIESRTHGNLGRGCVTEVPAVVAVMGRILADAGVGA